MQQSSRVHGHVLADRYELGPVLGQGGMARVHQGLDRQLGRQVAIKVLAPPFDRDGEFVERFRREARAAAGLSHPNIVAVFDSGSDDGTHFIVTELVEGETLADRLRRDGPMPPADAVAVAVDIARALASAHARGLIHRDIKPGNVMLLPDGRVKVVDFGIARAAGSDTLTNTGVVLGSTAYLSPEQAGGQPVDERADLYSLGCVLYEMLTGQRPVQRRHADRDDVPARQRGRPAAFHDRARRARARGRRPAMPREGPEAPVRVRRRARGRPARRPARARGRHDAARERRRGRDPAGRPAWTRPRPSRSARRAAAAGGAIAAGAAGAVAADDAKTERVARPPPMAVDCVRGRPRPRTLPLAGSLVASPLADRGAESSRCSSRSPGCSWPPQATRCRRGRRHATPHGEAAQDALPPETPPTFANAWSGLIAAIGSAQATENISDHAAEELLKDADELLGAYREGDTEKVGESLQHLDEHLAKAVEEQEIAPAAADAVETAISDLVVALQNEGALGESSPLRRRPVRPEDEQGRRTSTGSPPYGEANGHEED